ncbi:tumor necrosis factor a (TNF superfamily, member 2) [Anguilla rostrata]|uniref:tumor necrosis factor a (TNF superfamily, member 2) n=1 Tax=Anguilla rostrata TaxID=7938 RepID=UPI0030CB62F3
MKGAKEQSQTLLLDVEVGLETQRHTSRPWRWAAAALAVSLCVAAAVLLTWRMQNPDQSQEGSGLQLKLRELAGSDKAAIHLEADDVKPPYSVLWSKDTGHTFYQGGLDLENNEIVIPREGLYFVYSQASFQTNCHTQSGAGELVHISHAVDRFSDSYGGKWEPLMSALRPTCVKVAGARGSGKRWHSGIYLGGVFRLLEGDRLRTVTKDPSSLDREAGKTFFGAFTL